MICSYFATSATGMVLLPDRNSPLFCDDYHRDTGSHFAARFEAMVFNLELDVMVWVARRPGWQQDVLEKICNGEQFTGGDIDALADQLIAGQTAPPRPVTPDAFPGVASAGSGVTLIGIKDVIGVNALSPSGPLTFGRQGLTIVYGYNASGKSGYARILQQAIGARVRADILGDVFDQDTEETPQSAVIEYADHRAGESREWSWPGALDQLLAQAHFYDDACGKHYLSTETELTYRPAALVVLDRLIDVCDSVRDALTERLRQVDAEVQPLPAVPDGTVAARFLADLSAVTAEIDIDAACAGPEDIDQQLAHLVSEEARLQASDSTRERTRLLTQSKDLATIAKHAHLLAEALSPAAVDGMAATCRHATELRTAARIASERNFDAEPVCGVGTDTWRALWNAARSFSEAEAYHDHDFPVTDAGARCVLCHQKLTADAAERLRRFHAYLADTTERDAADAEQRHATDLASFTWLCQLPQDVTLALEQVRAADESAAAHIGEWLAAATAHVTATKKWLENGDRSQPAPLPDSPAATLADRSDAVRAEADALDAATFAATLRDIRASIAELRGQIALTTGVDSVRREVERRRRRQAIESAKTQTDTSAITRKSSDLTREYVTREIRDRFTREAEQLQLRRITLDDRKAVKGKLRHRPALLGAARGVSVGQVLSEGEQTALGLAGLFTEVAFDETCSAVVLDDPVTSLDHERRDKVAKRLVEIARERQVVVFTHDITFVDDLTRHGNDAQIAVTDRYVQRRGHVPGLCTDTLPWCAKDVGRRIDELETELARIKRERCNWTTDEHDEACSSWAGRLSETWERTVTLHVVNEIFDRGESQVRPAKVRILSAITEADNDDFQQGYGRCSTWARRHDKAPQKNYVPPEPDDMAEELNRLREWWKRIKSYARSS